jgi:ribosome biogenesis GTPase
VAERQGRVLWGSNNIYAVEALDDPGVVHECRIKGKQLAVADEYNVLVPGDLVCLSLTGSMLTSRLPRQNALVRWNKKDGRAQAFAANLDVAYCVCAPDSPPFRPRFVDRCLVAAAHASVKMVLILNKSDQPLSSENELRLADYRRLGYEIVETSVVTGQGIDQLASLLTGQTSVFMGQSGVGKSSLLNILLPGTSAKIGEMSAKFNRGRHTTVLAKSYHLPAGGTIIDTPGVREFEPANIDPQALPFLFPEIATFANACPLYNCSHSDEPGCRVRRAAELSEIHYDRYESYLRLLEAVRLQFRGQP